MAEFSKDLLDSLTEFMIREVGVKVLDGITYYFVMKNDRDAELYKKYSNIKAEAVRCGYENDEVFRIYEVCNGYILDMDLQVAKMITLELSKSFAKNNGGNGNDIELVKDMPEQRRKRDIVSLAKYLKSEYDKGNKTLEVALFSRNSSNKIIINGVTPSGERLSIRYNAYAIRHWDIEVLNEKFLIPAGFRVKSIQPCEILPSKTGVSFLFKLESMAEYLGNVQ